ncbi:MAG: 50S ribosomal protein L22 [Armatimonadota bacterium]|nr:MAG: 50S ribosomal protein L22 [Armatimonadota bacterium]
MPAKATAKYIRMSPYKVRRVLALIRGRGVEEALAVLKFTPGAAAPAITKLVNSAAANAENNHGMDRERLWVREAYADQGPSLRRYRPGSIGRGGVIRRRLSHITVVLDERTEQPAASRGRRQRAPRAKEQ